MVAKGLIILIIAVVLSGCVRLTPQAKALQVTRKDEDVRNCKPLGEVRGHPPYIGPKDGINQIKNQASGLGADTLYVTSSTFSVTGVAYRCAPDGTSN